MMMLSRKVEALRTTDNKII
jgi:hypothetical protein